SSRPESLKCRAFTNNRFLNTKGVYLELGVVLRVCDRASEGFLYQYGRFFRAERQEIQRIRSRATLDFTRHFARLERRNTRKPICRYYLHCFFTSEWDAPYFATLAVCAPCFLNVRVCENSPSLCPTMFSVTKTELKILPLCT